MSKKNHVVKSCGNSQFVHSPMGGGGVSNEGMITFFSTDLFLLVIGKRLSLKRRTGD